MTTTTLQENFKQGMRRYAVGVSVVTSAHEGVLHGMTVTSFTSVALQRPTILVCMSKDTHTWKMVEASGRFAINLLSAEHADSLDVFSGRTQVAPEDRFEHVDYFVSEYGCPILKESLASFECEVEATYPGGETHMIVVGRVVNVDLDQRRGDDGPLVWFDAVPCRLDCPDLSGRS